MVVGSATGVGITGRKPRTLPCRVSPAQGESFASYVNRLAADLKAPLGAVLEATGIIEGQSISKMPPRYGTILSDERLEKFSHATRLPVEDVRNMLLASYDGVCLDLFEVDGNRAMSLQSSASQQWAYFAGSHVCPDCLSESNGVWQLRWKLPWAFACVKHRRLLLDTCPGCTRRVGAGRASQHTVPTFPSLVPDPLRCRNVLPPGVGGQGRASKPCGHRLDSVETPSLVDHPRLLKTQRHLEAILAGGECSVAGSPVGPVDYFSDLRSLCALILAHGIEEDLGVIPKFAAEAFVPFAEHREFVLKLRKGYVADGEDWRKAPRLRRYSGVPQSTELMAGILPLAVDMLALKSLDEFSQSLTPFVERLTEVTKQVAVSFSYFKFSPRLHEAFEKARAPQMNTFSRLHTENAEGIDLVREVLSADDVPQLFWEKEYEKLAPLLPSFRAVSGRRVCSMWTVKLATDCTWVEAATALGLPSGKAMGMANRFVSLLRKTGGEEMFAERILDVARRIAKDPNRVDYGERRRALSALVDIGGEDWQTICKTVGVPSGSSDRRSRYAAAWLWSHLTSGDYRLSPGFLLKNDAVERALYGRFVKDDLPDLEAALVRYGSSLTANLAVNA